MEKETSRLLIEWTYELSDQILWGWGDPSRDDLYLRQSENAATVALLREHLNRMEK